MSSKKDLFRYNQKHSYIPHLKEGALRVFWVKGVVTGEAKLLKKLLEKRFGALPSWAITKLESAAEEELETWGESILTGDTTH